MQKVFSKKFSACGSSPNPSLHHFASRSFIAQRIDRVQIRRLIRRVGAENNSYNRADYQSYYNPIERNHGGAFQKISGGITAQNPQRHANDSPHFTKHHGFDDELGHNIALA